MKIAILGYGKMGKTIERMATEQGDEVVLKVDSNNRASVSETDLRKADVAIDFSTPESGFENIQWCLNVGVPIVSGTTGWLEHYDDAVKLCQEKEGAFFYASNFSVGVNIFFVLNERLAELMSDQSQYKAAMMEIHHTQKLDAPSGTAISLAKGIVQQHQKYDDWALNEEDEMNPVSQNAIEIRSKRVGNVPGTHIINYDSAIDRIEIKHEAKGREGFAAGAIMAARWLIGKKGVFSMRDLLGLNQ